MADIWVVAANDARARILRAESPTGPLVEVTDLVHTATRLKDQDLTSDRPGRTFDSMGQGRHAKSSRVEPKRQEEIRFAQEVAETLEQGRVNRAFDRLAITASPEFLGLLRDKMGVALRATVVFELDKDYTALRAAELREHLPERL